MSKKLIISVVGIIVVAAGGYFGAQKMGLLGPDLVAEAKAQADLTCACETFDCTTAQTQWFNSNYIRNKDRLDALSEADHAAYKAESRRSADCQDALRP